MSVGALVRQSYNYLRAAMLLSFSHPIRVLISLQTVFSRQFCLDLLVIRSMYVRTRVVYLCAVHVCRLHKNPRTWKASSLGQARSKFSEHESYLSICSTDTEPRISPHFLSLAPSRYPTSAVVVGGRHNTQHPRVRCCAKIPRACSCGQGRKA